MSSVEDEDAAPDNPTLLPILAAQLGAAGEMPRAVALHFVEAPDGQWTTHGTAGAEVMCKHDGARLPLLDVLSGELPQYVERPGPNLLNWEALALWEVPGGLRLAYASDGRGLAAALLSNHMMPNGKRLGPQLLRAVTRTPRRAEKARRDTALKAVSAAAASHDSSDADQQAASAGAIYFAEQADGTRKRDDGPPLIQFYVCEGTLPTLETRVLVQYPSGEAGTTWRDSGLFAAILDTYKADAGLVERKHTRADDLPGSPQTIRRLEPDAEPVGGDPFAVAFDQDPEEVEPGQGSAGPWVLTGAAWRRLRRQLRKTLNWDEVESKALNNVTLEALLAPLTAQQAQVVRLRVEGRYRFVEIAEMLGIADSTVRTVWSRALEKMAETAERICSVS